MTDAPLVSIIIPTYNRAGMVREAIESALAQTYPHIEVVVVDDGSTDHTGEVLSAYGERIRSEDVPHGGRSAARNRGIEMARGEYLIFLDSDDLLLPDAVGARVRFMEGDPDVDLVWTNGYVGGASGGRGPLAPRYLVPMPGAEQRQIARRFLKRNLFALHCAMVRRAALGAVRFDPVIETNEDWDFWLRLLLSGARFAYLEHAGAVYRRHAANTDRVDLAAFDRAKVRITQKILRGDLDAGLPAPIRQSFRTDRLPLLIRHSAWHDAALALRGILLPDGAPSPRGLLYLLRFPALTLARFGKHRVLPLLRPPIPDHLR